MTNLEYIFCLFNWHIRTVRHILIQLSWHNDIIKWYDNFVIKLLKRACWWFSFNKYPASICLFKIKYKNSRWTSMALFWLHKWNINFNRFHTLLWCFHDWLWTIKCKVGSDCLWRRDVVVITTTQSTKPKLKFSRGSNPALTMIFDYQSNLVIFFVLS